jgi:hypothetical protein
LLGQILSLRGRFFEAVKGKILVESLVRGGREEVIWVTTVWAALVGIWNINNHVSKCQQLGKRRCFPAPSAAHHHFVPQFHHMKYSSDS